jgi:hypothetical protein
MKLVAELIAIPSRFKLKLSARRRPRSYAGEKTMPPKVVVNLPRSLESTARERAQLKEAFKSKIKSIVKGGAAENPVTNVGRVVTEIIVVNGGTKRGGSKRKAGKKK